MTLLYITDQLYLHGGLERVLANKIKAFSTTNSLNIFVCTINQNNNPPIYDLSFKEFNLIDLEIEYDKSKSYFTISNLKFLFKHLWRIKNIIKKVKPDYIIVCNYTIDFFVLPYIKKNAFLIKEYHSSGNSFYIQKKDNKNIFRKFLFIMRDFVEKQYDLIVLLNKDERKFYKSSKIKIIPNFLPENKSLEADLINKKVIAAGRLAPVKGFDRMISIWKKVVEIEPQWTLEIYGEGEQEYRDFLQQLIINFNLDKNVILKGATSNLQSKMEEASFYLMTSHTECFPMVLLEAMEVGLPVISFDCPTGPRNILQDGYNGYLIKENKEALIVDKIILLIKNENLRKEIGHNAFVFSKNFKQKKIIKQWLDLFKENLKK